VLVLVLILVLLVHLVLVLLVHLVLVLLVQLVPVLLVNLLLVHLLLLRTGQHARRRARVCDPAPDQRVAVERNSSGLTFISKSSRKHSLSSRALSSCLVMPLAMA